MTDYFINFELKENTLDIFTIRKSILKSINKNLKFFNGSLLDIGCGKMPYKKYILKNSSVKKYTGLDIENALEYDIDIKPDYTWDGQSIPFEADSFDTVMATEVLEHCPDPELVLKEIYRVLKPGGVFFFTVPFLWNLHEVPHDEYRFTPFALERILKNAGFRNINLKATGGWHASMAQMLGLWVRRSPMKAGKRKYLSLFLKPFIKYLIKLDKPETVTFKEGQMITGLYGLIRKDR
ncbi:class I SAM-dependent methyltransferase [Christiangramia fulva]|uniref:Class I SAM-dependent methyltransferase n=1 Tax=Christiangramia fulva TaxID=2126553 RepID=A0A2R3Z0R1_9FLAO|nr:class I SAM-dependent methyltransferase [Christiangramia fulva]AVR43845.1 class I SAM-dependent methyltransferase [Christiangramia fulva]